MRNSEKKHFIKDDLYKKIIENMPTVNVGVILKYKDGVLLLKRANAPEKGKWSYPAGRIYKLEKLEEAAKRKALEETGLRIKIKKYLGFQVLQFKRFEGVKHNVFQFMYLAEGFGNVKTDLAHSEWRVFNRIDPKWHPTVKKFIKESGVIS